MEKYLMRPGSNKGMGFRVWIFRNLNLGKIFDILVYSIYESKNCEISIMVSNLGVYIAILMFMKCDHSRSLIYIIVYEIMVDIF